MASALRQLVLRRSANTRLFVSDSASPSAGSHAQAAEKLWKNLSLYVALPTLAIVGFIVLKHEYETPHERPEFRPYEHLRIRRKNFPWGDGKKSLFHNPHMNALPDGYEDEH